MANKRKLVSVRAADRAELERRVRSQTIPARAARRARIVLLAGEGRPAAEIAELVGVSEPTVTLWRSRYAQRGLPGLDDQARSGRPPKVSGDTRHEVLWHTLLKPPEDLGVTHWSSRLLARRVVGRWHAKDLPHEKLLVLALTVVLALGLMGPASAGEITGTGESTPIRSGVASSICAFSGLNDFEDPVFTGRTQNWGQIDKEFRDFLRTIGVLPGDLCRGNLGD